MPIIASCTSPVSRQHLALREIRELRDAERAVVGHQQQQPIAAKLGGAEQEVRVTFLECLLTVC